MDGLKNFVPQIELQRGFISVCSVKTSQVRLCLSVCVSFPVVVVVVVRPVFLMNVLRVLTCRFGRNSHMVIQRLVQEHE